MATPAIYTAQIKPRPLQRQRRLNGDVAARVEQALNDSDPVAEYIKDTWPKLTRSMTDLYLGGCVDPKMPPPENNTYFLYISGKEDMGRVQDELKRARHAALQRIRAGRAVMPEKGLPVIEVRRLPPREQLNGMPLSEQGLLYLPNRYIVPGERFNEMYNWDSMFVVRGLLDSKRFDDAKHLVDNLLYEQEHYGTILNGNRTYFLDAEKSRSQPPLITSKVINIYDNWKKLRSPGKQSDVEWLTNAAQSAENYYDHWVSAPHLHDGSGLSRYASGRGTASREVEYCEPGHYEGALKFLTQLRHEQQAKRDVPVSELSLKEREKRYLVAQYLKVSGDGKDFALSPEFYKADTAMRESGFDPSCRFGEYNMDIMSYLPVCLNSLRLRMESGMTGIYERLLDRAEKGKGDVAYCRERLNEWTKRRDITKQEINLWLWDDGKNADSSEPRRAPCYRDRNINPLRAVYALPEFRDYNFATALFPLWVGAAGKEQAEETIAHILPALKTPHGLNTSDTISGCQWDKPFLWAPLQVVAVEALEHYDHYYEALDIATGYLNMISRDFKKTGALWEKYESASPEGSSDIRAHVDKGYFTNDKGFAWTNAAVIEMRQAVKRLKKKIYQERLEPPETHVDRPVRQEGIAAAASDGPSPLSETLTVADRLARRPDNFENRR